MLLKSLRLKTDLPFPYFFLKTYPTIVVARAIGKEIAEIERVAKNTRNNVVAPKKYTLFVIHQKEK